MVLLHDTISVSENTNGIASGDYVNAIHMGDNFSNFCFIFLSPPIFERFSQASVDVTPGMMTLQLTLRMPPTLLDAKHDDPPQ